MATYVIVLVLFVLFMFSGATFDLFFSPTEKEEMGIEVDDFQSLRRII